MELNKVERDLLNKVSKKSEKNKQDYILLHEGFVDNIKLTKDQRNILKHLVKEIKDNDITIVIGDKAFIPYMTSYNNTYACAGIKFTNIIN